MRHRVYRFRCYPTPAQAEHLRRTFGCARLVYNKALEYRHEAYFRRGEAVTYNRTSAMLTRWKQTDRYAYLNDVSSVPPQQALRHLQKGQAPLSSLRGPSAGRRYGRHMQANRFAAGGWPATRWRY
ncbi:helix-turn-helix domain-containing protein [Glycomyces xiaoerkulensis]|uniref:helix-turn-helix domain-containing protein n=1 Tax=Glycomyces xiaoerkulensis TaxID=2038139 RepID=UPI000C269CBE|nr:helix-turn-helix domain-containing protein [Glycomyces xiaoerkulensis]